MNYSTGFRVPAEELGQGLRERGILYYVDGTQSVGALRFDAQAVQPDMLAVHGYKWLIPRMAPRSFMSVLSCGNGCSRTSSAGEAIRTGAASTACITALLNSSTPRKSTKAAC